MPVCIVLEMDDDEISPRFDQSALITIDTQIDTLDGQPLEIPGTTAALPAIATLTSSFRESGRPIVHVVRLYLADGSNAEPSRSRRVSGDTPILRPGHAGRLIAPEILSDAPAELDDDLLLSGCER
jgi:nicotinamidase-related amidase